MLGGGNRNKEQNYSMMQEGILDQKVYLKRSFLDEKTIWSLPIYFGLWRILVHKSCRELLTERTAELIPPVLAQSG